MKPKSFFINLFLFFGLLSHAQTSSNDMRSEYLYENFANGIVLMKSGAIEKALLNYNTGDQSIVFEQGSDKIMTLTGLVDVDTIYFNNKKFIPGPDNSIYELVTDKSLGVQLLVTYSNKTKPVVAVTDKSGTERKPIGEVSNTLTNIYVLRPYKGDFVVEIRKNYWLAKSRQFYRADAVRQFNRVFPHHEEDIKNFIATNQIKFDVEPDMVKLTTYCNSL